MYAATQAMVQTHKQSRSQQSHTRTITHSQRRQPRFTGTRTSIIPRSHDPATRLTSGIHNEQPYNTLAAGGVSELEPGRRAAGTSSSPEAPPALHRHPPPPLPPRGVPHRDRVRRSSLQTGHSLRRGVDQV